MLCDHFFLGLSSNQKSNENIENKLPEITSPLLLHGTVILSENSVKYTHSTIPTLPTQSSIKKPSDNVSDLKNTSCNKNSSRPCSILVYPTNKTQFSPSIIQHSNTNINLYKPTENHS